MPGQPHTPEQIKQCLLEIASSLDLYDDMILKLGESVGIGTPEEFDAAGVYPHQREMQQSIRNWAADIDSNDPASEVAFVYLAERLVGYLPDVV
jgi:hypothetical protein